MQLLNPLGALVVVEAVPQVAEDGGLALLMQLPITINNAGVIGGVEVAEVVQRSHHPI